MAEDGVARGLLASVPEVHYDLMARIMPGVLTLALTSILLHFATGLDLRSWLVPSASPSASLGSGLLLLTFGFAVSWCLGMLLAPLGEGLDTWLFKPGVFSRFCAKHEKDLLSPAVKHGFLRKPQFFGRAQWAAPHTRKELRHQARITYGELHDGLKDMGFVSRSVLSKGQAEWVFYECACAGLLLVTVATLAFAIYGTLTHSHNEAPLMAMLAVHATLLTLGLFGLRSKLTRLWDRHASFLFIYLKKHHPAGGERVEAAPSGRVTVLIEENWEGSDFLQSPKPALRNRPPGDCVSLQQPDCPEV